MKPLPCPFCGCEEVIVVDGTTFRWKNATCTNCGAQSGEVRIKTSGAGTKEEWEKVAARDAITEWNRRSYETRDQIVLENSNGVQICKDYGRLERSLVPIGYLNLWEGGYNHNEIPTLTKEPQTMASLPGNYTRCWPIYDLAAILSAVEATDLQQQVAMLRDALHHSQHCEDTKFIQNHDNCICGVAKALTATESTASAYRAKIRDEVLEEVAVVSGGWSHVVGQHIARTIRSMKGENK